MKGLTHVDIGGELTREEWESDEGHSFSSGAEFPGAPSEMDIFYRTDEHKLYLYDGTAWAEVGGVPSGTIAMWHGLIANIPYGWTLCDGTDGTPDLADKFAKGAADEAEAGGTGGEATHTLTTDEMPAHTHTYTKKKSAAGSSYGSGTFLYETGNTGSTGGGGAHNNLPPYYEILYIMKL